MNRVDARATLMYSEAAEASAVVRAQFQRNRDGVAKLGRAIAAFAPRAVVTCARGSSDHAATYAKYLIETRTGLLTASAAPSVASVYGARQDLHECLFVAISQSGRSPDLLATARSAKAAGAMVLALVNDKDSPLAGMADHALALHAGKERSVAATKSYIASLAAIAHFVAAWMDDEALCAELQRAPELLARAWQLDWQPAVDKLRDGGHLFVIARGIGLAVAQEAALKCKETCGLHAEAFSGAEVMHGPQALLDEGFPALLFVQDDETREGMVALANALVARGADVMVAGASIPGAMILPTIDSPAALQPLLLAQGFYKFANALAISRGRDPDNPPHLRKVTETR